MLGLLILKEIRANIFTYRFAVTFVLAFVLLLVSTHVMNEQYNVARDNKRAADEARAARLAKIKAEPDPRERLNLLSNQGITTTREPEALSILVSGLEKEIPVEVHAGGWFNLRQDSGRFENPFLRTLMAPDYAYVIGVILSLLALIFSFDGVCGEKESQTLKLVLSYSVPRHLVLLSKWIGGYLVLICPFLLATATALLILFLRGRADLNSEAWLRIGLIVALSLIYLSLFFTIGLLISTLTYRPSTALIISLFTWAALLLVIPNLSIVAAKLFAPVPSSQKIAAEKVAIGKEIQLRMNALSKTMLSYGKKADEKRDELRQEGKRRMAELDEFFENKLTAQTSLCQTFSRLSPFPSFKYALTDLAMTGPESYRQFHAAERRFRDSFSEYSSALWKKQKQLPPNWFNADEVPQMVLFKPRLEDSLNNSLVDIILLVILNVIGFLGAFMQFLRYDVR